MPSFVKYQQFCEDIGLGVHNLDADVLKIALTDAAPNVATHEVLADISEIAAGFGYSAGGSVVAGNAYAHTTGTGKLTGNNVVFTAAGGAWPSFRYAILYNDTPSSPANPLIAYWDRGSSLILADTDTFTVDLTTAINILTLA